MKKPTKRRPATKPAKRSGLAAVATDAVDASFAPVVEAFARDRLVTSGRMMASLGLKVNGKIFAMHVRGAFVAKLPRARVDELVAAGTGRRFDANKGRPMKEWIAIDGERDRWVDLAREAYAFVKAGR